MKIKENHSHLDIQDIKKIRYLIHILHKQGSIYLKWGDSVELIYTRV